MTCELRTYSDDFNSVEMSNIENYDTSNNTRFSETREFLVVKGDKNTGSSISNKSAQETSETNSLDVEANRHFGGAVRTILQEKSVGGVLESITLYMMVSISIVLFNYKVFSEIIEYPILVSWFQQLLGLVIFHLLKMNESRLGFCLKEFAHFESFEWGVGKYMVPLAFSFIGMVSLSNICLKHVLVSTYQVARSTTILFNLLLSYVILKQKLSVTTVMSCIIVMVGFILGAFDSRTLNANGMVFGVFSSIIQSFYSVLVKKQLSMVNNNQIQLLYYQLYLSSVMFVPILIITGEIGYLYTIFNFDQGVLRTCLALSCLIISGVLSVAINVSTFQLIKRTNSITFNVVALLKSCIQSIGGIILFNEIFTLQSILGIFLTLLGTFMYSLDLQSNSLSKYVEYRDLEGLD